MIKANFILVLTIGLVLTGVINQNPTEGGKDNKLCAFNKLTLTKSKDFHTFHLT